ncbi:MAG: helix-turn-helix domain-containing protein, partial [Bacteroidota bacterium]
LKCADVAQKLGVPAYQLSQSVNESTGENFNQYVNVHRIEAAKEMLRTRPELTIEAIGQECGFKSKSSFYAAFKKNTGTTPSKFV